MNLGNISRGENSSSARQIFDKGFHSWIMTYNHDNIDGIFVFAPPLGTALEPGSAQTLSVRFDPTNIFLYQSTTATVVIDVLKAPLTISLADSQRAAGAANPSFEASYAGFVLGQDASSLAGQLSVTTTATLESAPGTYSITGAISDDPRYVITITPGTLTVADKLVPATSWNTPSPITYGQALSSDQLNATADTNVPGSWNYTPAVGAIPNAGRLDITATFTPNNLFAYEVVELRSALTVQPAPLTIRAADAERGFGDPNPSFALQYIGFVNGDTGIAQAPSISTTATEESSPGTYPITLAEGSDPNYTITLVNGTLTVLEPDVSPLPAINIVYGENEITLSWLHDSSIRLVRSGTLLDDWAEIASDRIEINGEIATWRFSTDDAVSLFAFFRLERVEP